MYKISTETISVREYGNIFDIIKLLKEVGFDAFDFTMYGIEAYDCFIDKDNYLEQAKKLREYADELGIECNQCHSYFPTLIPDNDEHNKKGMMLTKRSLEVSGILGAKYCVVHPVNKWSAEKNQQMYLELLPFAKKCGVKMALENMWGWDQERGHACAAACSHHDDFNHHLDLLPQGDFGACLDLGHAEMKGLDTSAVKMIEELGPRLTCLHIHDNDRHHDSHKLPYTYGIDYEKVIDALAKVNYSGDITFEADTYCTGFPVKLYPQALKLMLEVGKYIRDELINRKKQYEKNI